MDGELRDAAPDIGADEFIDDDDDGLPNWWETFHGFDPSDPSDASDDPDDDGLTNLSEYLYETDPSDPDTDDDGLSDGDEINIHGTDPTLVDTDDDSMPDGWEITYALNPTNRWDASSDYDSDGFPAAYEWAHTNDPTSNTSFPAANLFVGTNAGQYASISEAIAAATQFDIISVAPAIYSGSTNRNLDLNKNIMLLGSGAASCIIDCSGGVGLNIYGDVEDLTVIANLTIKNTSYYGIYTHDTGTRIENCIIANNSGYGIRAFPSQTGTLLLNCTIADNEVYGVYASADANVDIENCILWGNGNNAIYGNPTVTTNSIVEGGYGDAITNNPLLTPCTYHITSNSPCIDTASTKAPASDMDGELRDAAPDIGADEFIDDDDDGLPNWWETFHGFDPSDPSDASDDPDDDGLTNLSEYLYETDPSDSDTDDDGFLDGDEISYGTDPADPESLPCSILGCVTYIGQQTGTVYVIASDNSNSWTGIVTSPLSTPGLYTLTNIPPNTLLYIKAYIDSNTNGLCEPSEAAGEYSGNPIATRYDLGVIDFTLTDRDSDYDGLPNWWEIRHFVGPTNAIPVADTDSDGLTNLEEYQLRTNPNDPDTDSDGFSDGDEISYGTDPADPESLPCIVSGLLSYNGPQTGTLFVVASTNSEARSSLYTTTLSSTGTYFLTNISSRVELYLKAYRDSNANASNDFWEAVGAYPENPIHLTNSMTNINITLINPDTDADGLPDWWEIQIVNSNTNDSITTVDNLLPDDDFDGDGVSNQDEWSGETDANNPASNLPVIEFALLQQTIVEAATNVLVSIPLALTSGLTDSVSVTVSVVDGSATPNIDYTYTNQTVVFSPETTNQTIFATVIQYQTNEPPEPVESVRFRLSNPQGEVRIGSSDSHVLFIVDSDADTDSDGIPDWWEISHNFDPSDPSDASDDPDNDNWTNLQEYIRGGNPTNSWTLDSLDELKLRLISPLRN